MRIALAGPLDDALVERFATALAGAGHAVQRFASARTDLDPEHWQKSWHPATTRALRKLLREEQIEVLHVLGWRGLSRDLVHAAARERVPAVVSLQDASASCLLGTRVTPEGTHCDVPAAAQPCLSCAGRARPTPWIPPDAQFLARYTHQLDLERELALARAVLVHDAAACAHARRFVVQPVLELLVDPQLAERLAEVYAQAVRAGAPDPGAPENPYAVLLAEATAREWDAAAKR